MGIMVETRERGKQPYRETRRTPCTVGKTLKTRNLLNLHWLFCLRISAKSWTTFCRDRIAPTCTIRHPVWPIVALQRRVRFSAPLARFCRIRWHQRRARRAERASFSVFVSNLDFRVPSLRQKGVGADRAIWAAGKEATREAQNGGRGYRGVAGLASSGPGAAQASIMSIFPQPWIQVFAQGAWHPVSGRRFPARTGNPNRRHGVDRPETNQVRCARMNK